MILVNKPAAPGKLLEGVDPTATHCAAYDLAPAHYDNGTATFEISSAIYGHKTVKDVLRTAQHSKCCFCEGMFEANAAADVEHFRPKKYSQQGRRQANIYPGYYWLAYTWSNLYYSCQVCNRSNKKNYFPLRDPARRARSHGALVADEEPLILDPGGPLDPRDHIKFKDEVAVGATAEGRATVDFIALNRVPLTESRLETYTILARMRAVAQVSPAIVPAALVPIIAEAQAFLADAVLPTSKYSAMAIDYLAAPFAP